MDYVEARSLKEACDGLDPRREGARIVAGGVALSIMMRWGFVQPSRLVSIRYVPELRRIRLDERNALRIGPAATHREVETSPLVRGRFAVLAEMERGLASVQVRNSGTLGGNLCHADSAADPAPVLLALGAQVEIVSPSGRRTLALKDFFRGYLTTALAPGEVLAEIVVPPMPPRSGAAYFKHSTRNAVDFPFAGVAALVALAADGERCASARLAVGAVAPTPLLSARVPAFLREERLTDAAIGEAARLASLEAEPASDSFGSAEYRRNLVEVLTRRALTQARERARAAVEP